MKTEHTGIKLTDEEMYKVTQTLGIGVTQKTQEAYDKHNNLLKELAQKYGYDWQSVEINPLTKEVLKRVEDECDNCDEEIKQEDIRIEE